MKSESRSASEAMYDRAMSRDSEVPPPRLPRCVAKQQWPERVRGPCQRP
jgi:hypothetical protein